jgi:signal transduction histidine kinase
VKPRWLTPRRSAPAHVALRRRVVDWIASQSVVGRLRKPRTTVRWRLTLLYGGLFLISGAGLLAITYTLVDHAQHANPVQDRPLPFAIGARPAGLGARVPVGALPSGNRVFYQSKTARGGIVQTFPKGAVQTVLPPGALPSPDLLSRLNKLLHSSTGQVAIAIVGRTQQISDMHQLEVESLIALAIMAVLSTALGWVVAGRVLAPLRTMTTTTQQISEANLNERLAMTGPPDELRRLADTIDGLLERMEGAFDAQRRFVANASHELRTPLTAVRALLELVLTDPSATVATYRTACEQVLEESEQQELLIDALLALASSQRGLEVRERVDLAQIAGRLVSERKLEAATREIRVSAELEPTFVGGDARLLERMASNLIDNAIRHNMPGGTVKIKVSGASGVPRLTIVNTGPVIPESELERLRQPFQRLASDRTGYGEGLGLGLSIVGAIVDAHGARLTLSPLPEGGLHASVIFPGAPVPEGDQVRALQAPAAELTRAA